MGPDRVHPHASRGVKDTSVDPATGKGTGTIVEMSQLSE
jgi:hypothetical protein